MTNLETDQNLESTLETSSSNSEKEIDWQVEAQNWKERALRAVADLQNSQKQAEIDLLQAKKNAKKQIAKQILEFINTLYLAFSFFPESEDAKVKNLVATLKTSQQKLILDLKNLKVETIEPKIGDIFDPTTMTALTKTGDTAETNEQTKVSQVASLGLMVDGQVVQPSVVVI